MKDGKIILLSKEGKHSHKKQLAANPEPISKCEIDLSKGNSNSITKTLSEECGKEYHSVKEENKTINSSRSKSSEGRVSKTEREEFFPMPPGKALKLYMNTKLTLYEQSEILDFKQIYFVGNTDKKINASKLQNNNWGFDDDRGDYKIVENDHIAYRYEILSVLGQGSFGQVAKVFDHKSK